MRITEEALLRKNNDVYVISESKLEAHVTCSTCDKLCTVKIPSKRSDMKALKKVRNFQLCVRSEKQEELLESLSERLTLYGWSERKGALLCQRCTKLFTDAEDLLDDS